MAINEQDIKAGGQPARNMNELGSLMKQADQAGKAGAPGAAGPAYAFSFSNPSTFGAPIGRGIGSEYLGKLMTALAEDYKQANPEVEITLLPIDNANDTALQYSVIVVAMRVKGESKVAYHALIVEATGDKITPIYENYNNNQVEVLRLTSDAANQILSNKVADKIRTAFPNVEAYSCDTCVVPRVVNTEDKVLIHKIALNAGTACNTELYTRRAGFEDMNLAKAIGDTNLVINLAFQQQQMEDAVGEPVRSDVLINFVAQKRQDQNRQSQQAVNSGDRDVRIAEASAFIDLVWAPVQPVQPVQMWAQQQPMPMQNQKYAARAIITNLGSNLAYTPASMLLALLSTLSLSENNNWFQSFRPVPVNSNDIDLRDIGALNIEANLNNEPNGVGTRIDTKAASFGLEHLGSLIANTIRPGLLISMDIPEAGAQTWYMGAHSAASTSNNGDAAQAIIDAANDLTNGLFGRNFQTGTPIFLDNGNRVHLGHWIDRNGNRRDIRDIDLLAVANLVGERNPTAMREWSDTFTRQDYPLNYRLFLRKKMIYALTNETAEFTGWAQRVTFTAQFLEALFKGAQGAGLNLRVNTPLSASDFNNQRGVADFVGNALLTPGRVFNQAGNFGYNQQFAQPSFIYDQRRQW